MKKTAFESYIVVLIYRGFAFEGFIIVSIYRGSAFEGLFVYMYSVCMYTYIVYSTTGGRGR